MPEHQVLCFAHLNDFSHWPVFLTPMLEERFETEARHLLAQGHQVISGNRDEGVLEKSSLAQARADRQRQRRTATRRPY